MNDAVHAMAGQDFLIRIGTIHPDTPDAAVEQI